MTCPLTTLMSLSTCPLPSALPLVPKLGAPPSCARHGSESHHLNARLVLATTGLHLAQFRHRHRPLAQAIDYAELFIYDEAQQEAVLGDVAILGALPRKCLVLRLATLSRPLALGLDGLRRRSERSLTGSLYIFAPHASLSCHSSSAPSCWMICPLGQVLIALGLAAGAPWAPPQPAMTRSWPGPSRPSIQGKHLD